jgi:hypothetical protein
MIGRRVASFEKFVLTPLSFLLPVVALAYFIQAAWFVGAYFLLAWFCIGLIGSSIHKEKDFDKLVQGDLTAEANIRPKADAWRDAHELARPLMRIAWVFAVTATVLLFHYRFRWIVSIPIGVSVGIVMPMIFVALFARPTK